MKAGRLKALSGIFKNQFTASSLPYFMFNF
jgi:hypothetical protein